MNIALDAYPLAERTSGIASYVRNMLAGLTALDEDNRYFLYSKSPFDFPARENVTLRHGGGGGRAPSYENTLWLFTKGVWMMKKDNIDVFWGTRQMLPPCLPGKIKKVVTVYDLVWHYFPETVSAYNLMVLKTLFKRSVKSSDRIITISKATSRSLTDVIGVPEEKITVAYPAANGFAPMDRDSSAGYISSKYGTSKDYILTVSTVEPRKNLITLLRAFSELRGGGYQLLVAGASGWKTSSIFEECERLGLTEREVKFLGYIPDEDMNRLYSGAALFVFPSIYEGFGIPPLEAMASGAPVVASNASSLPEVVGEAGVLLDPYDIDGWRAAMTRVLADTKVREGMRRKGLAQASRFSWEESARRTLRVFSCPL